MFFIFRKQLNVATKIKEDRDIPVLNKPLLSVALGGLIICIILMAISSYINLEMWYIPLICSTLVLIICSIICLIKKYSFEFITKTFARIPYSLIPFLLSMAVIISTLEHIGFIEILSKVIDGKNVIFVGVLAFLFANLINNIPMTILFTSVFQNLAINSKLLFSVIFSSNICAFFTPIGALAGIMFIKLLKQNNVEFSYHKFVLYGTVVAIPTLLIGLLAILLI